MNGLIVLEGPDGVGKTTLAKYLVDNYRARYLHLTYRFKDKMPLYQMAALHHAIYLAQKHDCPVIIDRWWPSEQLYAAEYRGGTPWPHLGRLLDRTFLRYGVYIFCLPDELDLVNYAKKFEALKTNRVEMYENTVGVARRYINLFYGGGLLNENNTYCDQFSQSISGLSLREDVDEYQIIRHGNNLNDYCEQVMTRLQLQQLQVTKIVSFGCQNAVGNVVDPRFLFIGDRSNSKNKNYQWPFIAYQNCSLFLAQTLHQLQFNETTGAWVNINDKNGVVNVRKILKNNPTIKVILLGSEAEKTYTLEVGPSHNNSVRHIFHPQYYRRFKKITDLVTDLRKALYGS
jgi:hypothetical protein